MPRDHKTRDHSTSTKGSSEERKVDDTVIVVENIDIDEPIDSVSKSMIERSKTEGRIDGKSPSGRSTSGRSPIERSLSCDLRPPNISPFDGQKEWAAIESIMASFVTQTSLTTTTTSSDQNSSDQVESEVESKAKLEIGTKSELDMGSKGKEMNDTKNEGIKSSETIPKLRNKPEVPKRPSLAPKPKIPGLSSSMSLDSRPGGSRQVRTTSRSPCFDTNLPVFDWATMIGLSESIAQSLVEHGFDDLRFMVRFFIN